MPSPSQLFRPALLLCLSLLLPACGGGGGSGGGSGTTDTTAPTVLSQAPASRPLGDFDVITLVFSESMDTASYTLGGNMAAESDGGVWSKTTALNDTLTITQLSGWSADTNRTLIVNANDLAGNALSPLTLTYDVYRGVAYYVNASMPSDLLDGLTPATAKKTIMAAIDAATAPAVVLVQSGVYQVASGGTERIVLKEGVSLYGGYNADFTSRVAGASTIADTSTLTTALPNPNFAVLGNAGITSATLLDGFTIVGTNNSSNLTAGLRLRDGAAPTVQHNTINGGSGSTASYAVYLFNNPAPLIQHNTLDGGAGVSATAIAGGPGATTLIEHNRIDGGSGTVSRGIDFTGGTSLLRKNTIFGGIRTTRGLHTIENNLIHAGQGASSIAISSTESDITLRNNTIYASEIGIQFGYADIFGSGFTIQNNIIMTQSSNGLCIDSSWPWPPANNVLHCAGALYRYLGTSYLGLNNAGNLTTNADGTGTQLSPAGANNVAADPLLADLDGADNNINTMADNDWHLSAGTPASVSTGGLNGIEQGWTFTDDMDGVTRPATGMPWSIGAYERN